MSKEVRNAFVENLDAAYASSTASNPVDLDMFDWDTLNNLGGKDTKKIYGYLSSIQKKGVNGNGGFMRVTGTAIDDGFDFKKLPASFFKNFDFSKNYLGDTSKIFPESGSSSFKKSAFGKLKWDTLPYESMSMNQTSSIDWGKINFTKGDLTNLDLSKVEWDELKKKGVKTFGKYFAKLSTVDKITMLEDLDAASLSEMGDKIPYETIFGKNEAKKIDDKFIDMEIDGQDFRLLGQAMPWQIANAYAGMQGFELANMNDYSDEIQPIRELIIKVANEYAALELDGKFSSKDMLNLALNNLEEITELAPVFDIKIKKVIKGDYDQVEELIDKINKFNLESTEGPGDQHEVWVSNSSQSSPQVLLNLINGDQRELQSSNVEDTFFALYKV